MLSLARGAVPSGTAEFTITGVVVVCSAEGPIIDHGALAVRDGVITAVGTTADVMRAHPEAGAPTIDGAGFVVAPGLINAHTHAPMGFFRGLGHGPVARPGGGTTMIEELFYPAEKNLSEELIEPLSYSYLVDALKSGSTCCVDSYSFASSVGRAMERIGMRGVVGEHIADLGGHLPSGRDLWTKVRARIEQWPHTKLVRPMVYAHAADTMSHDLLKELGAFARGSDLPFHMHLSQSSGERQRVAAREGLSPVAFAARAGVLGPRSMLVHLVSVDEADTQVIADSGATAVICAASEMIYERLPPLALLARHGVPWCIGTDCAASNDTADMLAELRLFRLVAKEAGVPLERSSPHSVLAAATRVPAGVLGIGTGTLAVGSPADCVFLERDLGTEPLADPVIAIVHSFTSRHVKHVMIDGKWSLWDRSLARTDEADLTRAYLSAVGEIKRRAGL